MNYNNVNVNVSDSQSIIKALQNYNTVILKPNIVDNRNVLTQEMMSERHTKYVIRWNYSLEGTTINVPEDCIIEFAGGTIDNGVIVGNNTRLIYSKPIDEICKAERQGTWIYDTSVADEEDITSVEGHLKFKDRSATDGMGRKILRKNIVDGVNTLTQSMINQPNTIYVIQYDFTLGENITVPAGCVLEFDGGSLSNGVVVCNDTIIQSNNSPIFSKITLSGNTRFDIDLGWFKESSYCVDSAYNLNVGVHVKGTIIIDEPMHIGSNFVIYGDDKKHSIISLSSAYSGEIKSIFIVDRTLGNTNHIVIKDLRFKNTDYGIYRNLVHHIYNGGSFQSNTIKNIYIGGNDIKKTFMYISCYGYGVNEVENVIVNGATLDDSIFYIDCSWINLNRFEKCQFFDSVADNVFSINGGDIEVNNNVFNACHAEALYLSDDMIKCSIDSGINLFVLSNWWVEKLYYKEDHEVRVGAISFSLSEGKSFRNIILKENTFSGNIDHIVNANNLLGDLTFSRSSWYEGSSPTSLQKAIKNGTRLVAIYVDSIAAYLSSFSRSDINPSIIRRAPYFFNVDSLPQDYEDVLYITNNKIYYKNTLIGEPNEPDSAKQVQAVNTRLTARDTEGSIVEINYGYCIIKIADLSEGRCAIVFLDTPTHVTTISDPNNIIATSAQATAGYFVEHSSEYKYKIHNRYNSSRNVKITTIR